MSLVVPFDEIFSNQSGLLANHASWERINLGEVCTILNGFPFKSSLFNKSKGFPIVRIRDLAKNSTETFYSGNVPAEFVIRNGDLLVGMDGNFRCYEWQGNEAGLNQRVCKITSNSKILHPKFLLYGLNGYLKAIEDATSSVTVGHLSSRDILRIPFPLPPLDEQRRIVAKLEKLLEKVNACQKRLDKIPRILKRFRQSILAAACSGRLTTDWRENRNLDDNWPIHKLSDLGKVTGGITKNSKRQTAKLKVPYLRVANVYENRLKLNEIFKIGVTEQEFERTRLIKKDVLFVEGNGSLDQIGRVALWDGSIAQCVHQNHLIKFRANGSVVPTYVLYQMMAPEGRAQLMERSTSSAGLNTLSISKISEVNIPVPSLVEQEEIIHRIGKLFKIADQIEARYNKAKTQVNKLTQSILAKAFRGELVTQDPADEPAGKLLTRVKQARNSINHSVIGGRKKKIK